MKRILKSFAIYMLIAYAIEAAIIVPYIYFSNKDLHSKGDIEGGIVVAVATVIANIIAIYLTRRKLEQSHPKSDEPSF
jgi:membrane protein DedA with SNARE-associated domain